MVDYRYGVRLLCTFDMPADQKVYESTADAAHASFIATRKTFETRVPMDDSVQA